MDSDKLEKVRSYLVTRGFARSEREWQDIRRFIEEIERARGDMPAEVLGERVLRLVRAEQEFQNHLRSERARFH